MFLILFLIGFKMGRRKAAVNQNKSGVAREGTCLESGNIFTIAVLYHERNGKRT